MMAGFGVIFLVVALSLLSALHTSVTRPPLQRLSTATRASSSGRAPREIWTNCSSPGDPVNVNSLSIYPFPPKRGDRVSLQIDLTLKENVTDGSVSAELKYGIIPVFSNTWSMCDFAKEQGWRCPLSPGHLQINFNTTIPKTFVLHGHVTGRGYAEDQNGSELVCVEIDFHI